jgi:SAM-dependent methyltransferase
MLQGAWIAKALTQQALSHLPGGNQINYFLQRHVARSLPHSDATFLHHCEFAGRYVSALREHTDTPVDDAHCLEFGAGWDCAVALIHRALSVPDQILVDINAKLHYNLINETLAQARRLADKVAKRAPGADVDRLPFTVNCESELNAMGIKYWVGDLMELDWPRGFDMIHSTSVLEHIPADDLPSLVQHCHGMLRPGGLFCAAIDTADHYSRYDRSISHVNFLRYSPSIWPLFSPPLHYQNRLRVSDHLKIIKEAGFKILEATRNRIRKHPNIRPHHSFQNYAIDDLLCGGVFVVAQKK